jgi:hypothetical protein
VSVQGLWLGRWSGDWFGPPLADVAELPEVSGGGLVQYVRRRAIEQTRDRLKEMVAEAQRAVVVKESLTTEEKTDQTAQIPPLTDRQRAKRIADELIRRVEAKVLPTEPIGPEVKAILLRIASAAIDNRVEAQIRAERKSRVAVALALLMLA